MNWRRWRNRVQLIQLCWIYWETFSRAAIGTVWSLLAFGKWASDMFLKYPSVEWSVVLMNYKPGDRNLLVICYNASRPVGSYTVIASPRCLGPASSVQAAVMVRLYRAKATTSRCNMWLRCENMSISSEFQLSMVSHNKQLYSPIFLYDKHELSVISLAEVWWQTSTRLTPYSHPTPQAGLSSLALAATYVQDFPKTPFTLNRN